MGSGGGLFYGSGQAMLFKGVTTETVAEGKEETQKEEEFKIFKWSGANRYIQLCDAIPESWPWEGEVKIVPVVCVSKTIFEEGPRDIVKRFKMNLLTIVVSLMWPSSLIP